ncbi:MAG: hypothetical protein WDN69_18635 [Aliidongia sp.]
MTTTRTSASQAAFQRPKSKYGPAFAALLREMQGPELRAAFETKFDIDLSDRPTMVTVRGRAQAKDGRIHTDSKTKIITVLLYMNGAWEAPGRPAAAAALERLARRHAGRGAAGRRHAGRLPGHAAFLARPRPVRRPRAVSSS